MADNKQELVVEMKLDATGVQRDARKAAQVIENELSKAASTPAKNFSKNAAAQEAKYFVGMRGRQAAIQKQKQHFAELMSSPIDTGRNFGWSSQSIGDLMKPKLSGESAKDAASVFMDAGLTDTEKKLMSFSERLGYAQKAFETFKGKITKGLSMLKSGFTGLARAAGSFAKITPFARVGAQLKDANKRLGTFLKAFKRVVTYKAIRGGIGAIIQGWKDGLTNLYGYSQTFGTQFHNTMDSLATDLQFVHNGIAAMAAPLINAVAPAIQAIAQRVVDLANAIGYFFAKILGQASFSAAIRGSKAFQELGGSAKEAKKQLMGFDELNVLTAPSDGGAAGADYGKMFEEWSTELEEGSIEQRLRQAIEGGDWEGVGSLLAEKLNGLTARFGEGQFGTALGKKIQKGLDIARGFMFNYDFTAAGAAVATNLNNLISNVDFYELGELLARGLTSIFDFGIGFITTFNWADAAASIGNVIKGWFDHLSDWIQGVDWHTFGSTLFNMVYDAATNIDFGGIAHSFFEFLGSALGAAFGTLSGWFDTVMEKVGEYFDKSTEECGGNVVLGFLNGIWKGMVGIVKWIYDNVVKPFMNGLRGKDGLGLDEGDNLMYDTGEDIIDQLLQGMLGVWPKVADFLKEAGKAILNFEAESKRASELPNYTGGSVPYQGEGKLFSGGFSGKFMASGGTVPTGQLFIANEAGPELIGTVGGQTTVTSQDQFTAGMEGIMDNTNTVILQAAQFIVNEIQRKDMTPVVAIGDRDIVRAYDRGKTLAGGSLVK